VERFGGTPRRVELLAGLRRALVALREAGCRTVYVDGSFVADAREPNDFDACWEPEGVELRRLDPVLYDFAHGRRAQKRTFGGELFPASFVADAAGYSFFELFQRVRGTEGRKGLVVIDLKDGP